MTDRTVTVRGRFDVSGIVSGARTGALAVKGFASEVNKASGQQRDAFDSLGQGAAVAGGLMVAGFSVAVKAAMDFDKAMSQVGAVSGATGKQLAALRQAAIEAGRDTAFSATQAAEAQGELAKAGVSTADILGGALKGSLDLAAAGQIDLGRAAEISAQAMATFNLKGKDVGHIADVLSAGANKSTTNVETLSQALSQGGLVASQMGLSLEETVGTLAAFDQNALKGSDAGTSLKTMLIALSNPTDKARSLMEDLGISAYDASGNFVGMASFAGQLQTKLSGLTQEQRNATLAQIFGTDAVRAANIAYKLGEDGIRGWTTAVNDQGAASRTAAAMADNLAGDLEKLGGSLETALIQGGSTATGVLRGLTQGATAAVDAFSALPGPIQGTVTVVAGLTGAVTLLGGAMVVAVPRIAAYKAALAEAGPRTQAVGRGLSAVGGILTGPWGLALAGATIGLGIWAAKHTEAKQRVDDLKDSLDAETGALTQDTRALIAHRLESDGLLRLAQRLGVNVGLFTDAVLGNQNAIAGANTQLDAYVARARTAEAGTGRFAERQAIAAADAAALRGAINGTNSELADAAAAWKREHAATQGATGAAKDAVGPTAALGRAQAGLAADTGDAADAVNELRASLDKYFTPALAAFKTTGQLKDGYRDLIGALGAAKGNMDGNSEASARLRSAFASQLDTVADLYTATARQTGSTTKATAAVRDQLPVLYALAGRNKDARTQVDNLARATGNATGATRTSREAFLKTATAMGIGRERAEKLWRELAKIKSRRVKVDVTAEGHWTLGPRPKFGPRGVQIGWATGGPIPASAALGPGGPTSDDVPIWASAGEHMWTAAEVRAAGGHEAMARMRAATLAGQMRGYASGGPISMTSSAVSPAQVADRVYAPIRAGAGQMVAQFADAVAKAWKKYAGSGGPVVAMARAQVGDPYVWGAAGPNAFDCSGLTWYAWKHGGGKDITRTTYTQRRALKTIPGPIPGAVGQPHPGHTYMASRPGWIIEAPRTGLTVREVPLNRPTPWWGYPRAGGGPVTAEQARMADRALRPGVTAAQMLAAKLAGLAGDPGGLGLPGYGAGGWVRGRPGTDRVPLLATAGEYVIAQPRAAANAALVEAINDGRVGQALVRRPVRATAGAGNSPGAAGGAFGGGPMHITLSIGARHLGEVIIDPLRRAVWTRGGDVQAVLGRGRG